MNMSSQTVIEKYSAPLTDFSEDKLNLKSFADDLTKIIMSPPPHPTNEYSKVIALDSGWGTGKTSFINMWTKELETGSKFICRKYNAWENDDSPDALIPILCRIHCKEDTPKRQKFKRICCQIISIFGPKIFGLITQVTWGINLEGFAEAMKEYREKKLPDMNFDEFTDWQKHKELFRKLTENIRGEHEYLLICIDELDRCRPTFAIETLEVVKHFFNVPNVVFVFSLDMNQLQKSIKTIYGDIDSRGYLQRFFDYIIPLPKQELKSFLKDRLEILNPPRTDYEKEQRECEITWLSWIARRYSISLQSLNNICIMYTKFKEYALSNFDWTKRNWKNTLEDSPGTLENDIENDKYGQWYYFKTYLTFIVMKYFCPDEYWSFIQNGTNFDDLEKNKYEILWYLIFNENGSLRLPDSSEEDKAAKFISSYTKDIASLTPHDILEAHSKTLHGSLRKSRIMRFDLFRARYRLLVGSEIDMAEYQDLQLPTFIDKIIEESLVKKVNSVKPLQ